MLQFLKQRRAIWRFQKRISLNTNLPYFNTLYQNIDGYECAQRLNLKRHHADAIIYGDVDFYSFAAALSQISPSVNDVFIDLGSGVGKACMTAALAYGVHHCRGIEIEPKLHELALIAYDKAQAELQKKLYFMCDDYFKAAFSDATIVYVNATALFEPQWSRLEACLVDQLNAGTNLLVMSKKLNAKHFRFISQHPMLMDYGQSHLGIYQKI